MQTDPQSKQESSQTVPDCLNLSDLSPGETKVCRNVMYRLKAVGTPAVLKALRNFSEDPPMHGNDLYHYVWIYIINMNTN